MKKRIMVLGAGVYQAPLIKKAREMGFETVVVSPKGKYPGIPLADIFLDIDTTDADCILQAAREYGISGIATTGTDVSIPAMGIVVDALGLKGPTRQMADTVSSKTAFRAFLRDNELSHPDFIICNYDQDAWDFYQELNDKIVIKPDDSSGSRGVTIIGRGQTEETVMEAYRNALTFSRNGRVCAEAFIEGEEVGGDAFLVNGRLQFFAVSCKHMNGVIVQGHSLPSNLPEFKLHKVRDEITRVVSKLGYIHGPLNFDVVIGERKAIVLEIGLRNGGNGILDLIYYNEGIDLLKWLLAYAMGNAPSEQKRTGYKEISSYVFGPKCAGKLIALSSLQELTASVPEVFEMVLAREPGDHVDEFIHNANLVGYLLIRCGTAAYKKVSEKIRDSLRMEVE